MTDAAEQLAAHLARKQEETAGYTWRQMSASVFTTRERFDPARAVTPLAARLLRASNGLHEAGKNTVIL
jgi:hypothetical protein